MPGRRQGLDRRRHLHGQVADGLDGEGSDLASVHAQGLLDAQEDVGHADAARDAHGRDDPAFGVLYRRWAVYFGSEGQLRRERARVPAVWEQINKTQIINLHISNSNN